MIMIIRKQIALGDYRTQFMHEISRIIDKYERFSPKKKVGLPEMQW